MELFSHLEAFVNNMIMIYFIIEFLSIADYSEIFIFSKNNLFSKKSKIYSRNFNITTKITKVKI